MPSQRWSAERGPVPLAGAIAAATTEAWAEPVPERRTAVFFEALRGMVGPDVFEQVQAVAWNVFNLQRSAPAGLEDLPSWALFTLCPPCRRVKRTRHTRPQNGRVKLQVLRDKGWLQQQVEAGRSQEAIATSLGCDQKNVGYWMGRHSLAPKKILDRNHTEETVRRMHAAGEAPGTIARALDTDVWDVRRWLQALGLANLRSGHVYMHREWWRSRMEDQSKTMQECAREAGIRSHAATAWVKKFDLSHLTQENVKKRHRTKKYPILANPLTLRALLARNGDCYERAAEEVGCSSNLVARYARNLLGWGPKGRQNVPHGKPEWWEERVARGDTTHQMADEAGVQENTARERLRIYGLLDRAYANNARAERARRITPAA